MHLYSGQGVQQVQAEGGPLRGAWDQRELWQWQEDSNQDGDSDGLWLRHHHEQGQPFKCDGELTASLKGIDSPTKSLNMACSILLVNYLT